jgi:hypothetical protein
MICPSASGKAFGLAIATLVLKMHGEEFIRNGYGGFGEGARAAHAFSRADYETWVAVGWMPRMAASRSSEGAVLSR